MSEEYKQELLRALKHIDETLESGRIQLAKDQLASLVKHLERYEAKQA